MSSRLPPPYLCACAEPTSPEPCLEGRFRCDDGTCIPRAYKCDGFPQCPDSSDEKVDLCCKCHVTPPRYGLAEHSQCSKGRVILDLIPGDSGKRNVRTRSNVKKKSINDNSNLVETKGNFKS
ncbi:low-density lipoprotein receptor [Elysia marginata]|uniref:Low-density lipoprotein receptor n=1 Tax=Elysia marginata TaxID=1093978 RepID=A0AAV4F599_9GAST|nr:low-density lipoprotein receptor [Elysia marginata]